MQIPSRLLRSLVPLLLVLLAAPLGAEEEKPAGKEPAPETEPSPWWPPPPKPEPKDAAGPSAEEEAKEDAPPEPVPPPLPDGPLGDPRGGEVPLPAGESWDAFLMMDNKGAGVWTVGVGRILPDHAAPEVAALDDRGQLHLLTGYSGRWSATTALSDRIWLGGLAIGDFDPRVPGVEVYAGGGMGNLYQVSAHRHGFLDENLIAFLPGLELHTIAAGDFDKESEGAELLLFTNPPRLYLFSPTGPHRTWERRDLGDPGGLVRNAVVLPTGEVACVSRAGWLRLLTIGDDGGAHWETVHHAESGSGRVALRTAEDGPTVLYSTLDDGRVLRHERGAGGWKSETIYLGPQGPRGIVAGTFHEDGREAVAIFGYSKRIEVLSRGEEGWEVETVFRDRDRGHWITTAELDGRNTTTEIVASGYGGRVYLITRPPGYGRKELVDPEAEEAATPPEPR